MASPPCWRPRKSHVPCYFSNHPDHYLSPTVASPHYHHKTYWVCQLVYKPLFLCSLLWSFIGTENLNSLPCPWGARDGSGVFCLLQGLFWHCSFQSVQLETGVGGVRCVAADRDLGPAFITSAWVLESSDFRNASLCDAFSLSCISLPVSFPAGQRQLHCSY